MWFIKDPQDQNSHPIRDILDRPTFTQLRKICVSGVMYSFVVACVVGSVAGLLVLGSKSSIMPFRWKNRYVFIFEHIFMDLKVDSWLISQRTTVKCPYRPPFPPSCSPIYDALF